MPAKHDGLTGVQSLDLHGGRREPTPASHLYTHRHRHINVKRKKSKIGSEHFKRPGNNVEGSQEEPCRLTTNHCHREEAGGKQEEREAVWRITEH